MEFISERKHVNNLFYVRELLKLDLDNWVEERKNGKLKSMEDVMEVVTNLSIVDDEIGELPSKVKRAEDGTQVVVRTDLRRLVNGN